MSIYLDNAATSFPKPPVVLEAISEYMLEHIIPKVKKEITCLSGILSGQK